MHRLTLRFGGFYTALFLIVGIQLPYWPVWLKEQGMTTSEIGILVATLLWVKVAFNPIAGHLVDATGKRRAVLFGLSVGSLLGYAAFTLVSGFPAFVLLSIICGALFAALLPIGDNLTMTYVVRHNLDYGRIRLWGSLAFIITSASVGRLLDHNSPSIIIWLIVFALVPLCFLVLTLPETPKSESAPKSDLRWKDLISEPVFWIFMTATAMSGASHAIYYGFATLHWDNNHIGHTWIGILWGVGVAAEVILFAFSSYVVQRVGVFTLIILGSAGGIIRWTALATVSDPWILLPIQCLHALTFGALHLGAMHFIARNIAPAITGRAQSLYAAMGNGVVLGGVTIITAPLFASYGGAAFYAMTACSVIGTGFALWLPYAAHKHKGSRVFRESLDQN